MRAASIEDQSLFFSLCIRYIYTPKYVFAHAVMSFLDPGISHPESSFRRRPTHLSQFVCQLKHPPSKAQHARSWGKQAASHGV